MANPSITADDIKNLKVICYKCRKPLEIHDHKVTFEGVHFHKDCFNQYEHYYGLDKPID